MSRRFAGIFLVALLWSCGSDSNTADGGEAVTTAQLKAYCTADCAWKEQCLQQDQTTCETACNSGEQDLVGKYRADYLEAVTQCLASASCGDQQNYYDQCEKPAEQETLGHLVEDDEGYKDCIAKQVQCEADGDTFQGDYCWYAVLFIDTAKQELSTCWSKTCAEATQCMEAAFSQL